MRPALDSNILIYATLEPHGVKGGRAIEIINRTSGRGVLATQVLGEFVWVVRRRRPDLGEAAVAAIDELRRTFTTVDTTPDLLVAAADLNARHRVPFWDAVIWKAAASAGAGLLVTEDSQDGVELDGIRIVNPFNPANDALIDHLLPR